MRVRNDYDNILLRGRNSKEVTQIAIIRLNVAVFNEAIAQKGWKDTETAVRMGISTTQLWRVRLPEDDPRHNYPGKEFVAGALIALSDKKFEDLFILDDNGIEKVQKRTG